MVRFLNCQCWLKLEQFRDSVDYVGLNIITSKSLQDNCIHCIHCIIFLMLFKPSTIIILWIGRKLAVSIMLCLSSRHCILTVLQKVFWSCLLHHLGEASQCFEGNIHQAVILHPHSSNILGQYGRSSCVHELRNKGSGRVKIHICSRGTQFGKAALVWWRCSR